MKFEKIGNTIVCYLELDKFFFISPSALSIVASLDVSRIRIHSRKNVKHVIYIDEDNRQLKLNRIIAGYTDDRTIAVIPANDNPIDLRSENLMIEKLGFNKTSDFDLRKETQANSLSPLPEVIEREQLSIVEKELSPEGPPSSITPKRGKISLNPINDEIEVIVENFRCKLKSNDAYQNAKSLITLLEDNLGVTLE
ncbi:hypothetical protein AB1K89_09150 [Sporosarcina sp. 179-K 8C2 HS]|uniref:hypothetical protein n=1 Tax=Sporosarcina sp. 179-K 8C2 HS TaxID=3142387 RepID=UPI0039A3B904